MQKDTYVPLGGFLDCAESRERLDGWFVAFWSRYVTHYIFGKSLPGKRKLLQFIPKENLTALLPDFDASAAVDGTKWIWSLRERGVRRQGSAFHRENRQFRGERIYWIPLQREKDLQCVHSELAELSAASFRSLPLPNLSDFASCRRYFLSANGIAHLRRLFDAGAELQRADSRLCDLHCLWIARNSSCYNDIAQRNCDGRAVFALVVDVVFGGVLSPYCEQFAKWSAWSDCVVVPIDVVAARIEVATADERRFAGEVGVSEWIHDGSSVIGVACDFVSFVDFYQYEVSFFVLSFQLCGGQRRFLLSFGELFV